MTTEIPTTPRVVEPIVAAAGVLSWVEARTLYLAGDHAGVYDLLQEVRKTANELHDRAYANAQDWNADAPAADLLARVWWGLEDALNAEHDWDLADWGDRFEDIAAEFPELAVQAWMSTGLDREAARAAVALAGGAR